MPYELGSRQDLPDAKDFLPSSRRDLIRVWLPPQNPCAPQDTTERLTHSLTHSLGTDGHVRERDQTTAQRNRFPHGLAIQELQNVNRSTCLRIELGHVAHEASGKHGPMKRLA